MAEFENESFNESENGDRRLSWHTFTQYDERLASDLSVNPVLWSAPRTSHFQYVNIENRKSIYHRDEEAQQHY